MMSRLLDSCTMSRKASLAAILYVITICTSHVYAQPPVISSTAIDGMVKGKGEVIIQCNASTPSSPISWTLNGEVVEPSNDLDVNIETTGAHSVLTIASFKSPPRGISHAGEWRCFTGGLVSKKITLAKAKMKRFPRNSKDVKVEAVEGGSALIPCKPPNSKPHAETVFEKEGLTIDKSEGRFYLLSSGDLQISNVQQGDSGVYKCVAINSVLKDKHPAPYTVTLQVKPTSVAEFAPVKRPWSLGNQVQVDEGSELMLPCVFSSNPLPLVSWEKYPAPLSPNNSRKVEDNLLLENLIPEDSGTYNCAAEHDLLPSPLVISYVVDVRARPRVRFANRELFAVEGHAVTVQCIIEAGDADQEVQILWYRNGDSQNNDSQAGVEIIGNKLHIANVSMEHGAIYQCIMGNDVGEDTDYIKLHVQAPTTTTATTTTAEPRHAADAPLLEQVGRASVRLTWTISSDERVLSYQVKMKEGGDGWKVISRDIPKQARSQQVNHLMDDLRYKFMVVAVYGGDVYMNSPISGRFRLNTSFVPITTTPAGDFSPSCSPCPPEVLPLDNVTRVAGSIARLNCTGGDVLNYTWYKDGRLLTKYYDRTFLGPRGMLSIRNAQAPDVGWYTCQASNEHGAVNTSAYFDVIDDRMPYVNVHRRSTSTTTIATTIVSLSKLGSSVVVPPGEPTVTPRSATEVIIQWRPVLEGLRVLAYKIQYRRLGRDRSGWDTMDGTITDATSYKVTKLHPGVSYKFRVAATYSNGEHRFSPSVRVAMPDAPPAAPDVPPRLMTLVQTGNGRLLATWYYMGTLPVDTFIVQYQIPDRLRDEGWLEQEVKVVTGADMDKNTALISNLEDDMMYSVRIVAENGGVRGRPSNTYRRTVVFPFSPGSLPDEVKADKTDNMVTDATDKPLKTPTSSDSEMLYVILAAVLGSMVLLLIVFVAICGFRQRRQRRAMLASNGRSNKFADASKVLYGEQLKEQMNGNSHQFIPLNGSNCAPGGPNGTLSSVNSQRMSLNINPLNELEDNMANRCNGDLQDAREHNTSLDYNLMQHYPHYNSGGSRRTPTYHHNSHQSIEGSQRDGSTHYSHGSLPHYNVHQQYDPVRSATPQFSTFLPRQTRETSPSVGGKLPHPQGLRPVHYAHSPASSVCDGSQGSQQRRRRKKRSQHNRDHMINQSNSNPGSAREYNTNTDFSSGEGTGVEEYNQALPPPPMLPSSYGQSQPNNTNDTVESNSEQA